MDYTFSTLGWLHRSANSVGIDRFAEAAHRCGLALEQAARLARTPAERTIVNGLRGMIRALVDADAEARRILDEAVSGITEACAEEVDRLLDTTEGAA